MDKEIKLIMWPDCVTALHSGKKIVVVYYSYCSVCCKFNQRTQGLRNFSNKWTMGADSPHTSWQHLQSHKTQPAPYCLTMKSYWRVNLQLLRGMVYLHTRTPISCAMEKYPQPKLRLRHKFDIPHLLATEKLYMYLIWSIQVSITGTKTWELP